jgi:hypothetical protein
MQGASGLTDIAVFGHDAKGDELVWGHGVWQSTKAQYIGNNDIYHQK